MDNFDTSGLDIVYTDKEKCKGCIHYPICNSFQNFVDPDECKLFKREADLVNVVRCRECQHHHWEQEPCHGKTEHFCSVLNAQVFPDFYCYHGKRKEKQNVGL